jgi:hypothetical protein
VICGVAGILISSLLRHGAHSPVNIISLRTSDRKLDISPPQNNHNKKTIAGATVTSEAENDSACLISKC